ncbi:MAG: acyl-CoA dehydrogenase family protein [Acidobacteriota bacterium]|nr:acyl-CoA dehydrogenase family protein [Acidobacteriota bacterium]
MATTATAPQKKIVGGNFLIEETNPRDVFTPEDFNEQHQLIEQTAEEFSQQEILPNADRIEHKDFAFSRELLKKAADLGLTSVDIPEEYGGAEMDKVSSAIIADHIAKQGSFAVTFSAHVGIGTLPIVWFGTDAQKKKYLPLLASGEWVGAYALSESSSGSDAMNARAKAVLSPDGKHYVLNGEKMWITNAGFADLFVIFAKVDGEKFTAFLVERTFPGFSVGAEEHKLGIRGSSTCPLILNDCQVPVENVLGEIGKGATIAFNILNVGRFKLGAAAVGGARTCLANSIKWAKERKAFGKPIADFGMVREMLADIAIGIYAGESLVYRTVGMMDAATADIEKGSPDESKLIRKAIEEYAVECSIIKVWASEMFDKVVDNQVQIYGGYGFVEEYPAERAYRDSRVNRIFEGTNEINRLIITGWLLKRAMSGQLPLLPAIKKLMDEVMAGPSFAEEDERKLATQRKALENAKKIGLMVSGAASQKYMQQIADHQEVMGAIADIVIEVYAMDSVLARTLKLIESQGEAASATAVAITDVYFSEATSRVEAAAKKILADVAEGDMLRTQMTILRRLTKAEPVNVIAAREKVAARVLDAGKYAF